MGIGDLSPPKTDFTGLVTPQTANFGGDNKKNLSAQSADWSPQSVLQVSAHGMNVGTYELVYIDICVQMCVHKYTRVFVCLRVCTYVYKYVYM